jgi:hypothetical protein
VENNGEMIDLLIGAAGDRVTLLVGGVWITGKAMALSDWLDQIAAPGDGEDGDDDGVYLVDVVSASGGGRINIPCLRVTKTSIDAVYPGGLTYSR